jgi:hypothetical protein
VDADLGTRPERGNPVNRYRHLVVRVDPAHLTVVAEHVTVADARRDAALRDFLGADAIVWHRVVQFDGDPFGCPPFQSV